jgi:hypothetical protein
MTDPKKGSPRFTIAYFATVFLILILIMALSGCGSFQKKEVVNPGVIETTREVLIPKVPEQFLKDCNVTTPPDKTFYVSQNVYQRESILTRYVNDLLLDMNDCKTQIKNIRKYQDTVSQPKE